MQVLTVVLILYITTWEWCELGCDFARNYFYALELLHFVNVFLPLWKNSSN